MPSKRSRWRSPVRSVRLSGRLGGDAVESKILVVDDERTFNFPAIYARSSLSALEIIQSGEINELWLDHDLGGFDDTRQIVELLEWCAFEGVPTGIERIVIHSANPPAAEIMHKCLSRWYDNVIRVYAGDYI